MTVTGRRKRGPRTARQSTSLSCPTAPNWVRSPSGSGAGRLRTNIGNVAALDDAVAVFNPTERVGEDDHPCSSVTTRRKSTCPSVLVDPCQQRGHVAGVGCGGRASRSERDCDVVGKTARRIDTNQIGQPWTPVRGSRSRKRQPAGTERPTTQGRNKKIKDSTQRTEDLAILEQLNNDYVRSDQFNDVKRFSELLAEDFIVQTPGVTRNRAEFLEFIAEPRPFKDLAVHDVHIRILSEDVALIHGRATYTMLADGAEQEALYTDTYQKREGTWVCVSACAIAPGT